MAVLQNVQWERFQTSTVWQLKAGPLTKGFSNAPWDSEDFLITGPERMRRMKDVENT